MRRLITVLAAFAAVAIVTKTASAQTGRALELEDYYTIKSLGSARISPDGRWVSYTVSSRVEEDNSTLAETWIVRADGSDHPARVLHRGQDVSSPSWTDESRLHVEDADGNAWIIDPKRLSDPALQAPPEEQEGALSPDGRWRAVVRSIERAPKPAPELTDFEQRHADRFEGVQFDWYPFVRDGQEFPLPDRSAMSAAEIFIEPADGSGEARQLTSPLCQDSCRLS